MKAALALCGALLAACGTQHRGQLAAGEAAPRWSDPLSTGGAMTSSALRGSPVDLNFFATWCPPCNEEAPWIESLQRRYTAHGLRVVGVDVEENTTLARDFQKKYGLTYPLVVDMGTLQRLYAINGLPVHVFIDRSGTIHSIVIGEMSKNEIESAVKSIL